MPAPSAVNPANFKVLQVIFNQPDFSIAWGLWQGEHPRLAMRWNGDDTGDAGYPKTFGHPVWFLIPKELRVPFLRTLLGHPGVDTRTVSDVIAAVVAEPQD